jgi:AcrR family transcriptional regulator
MSAGNFYRYFPSKDAIIQAMVERDLAGIEEIFAAIISSDNPRAMLMQALDMKLDNHDCDEGALWAEILAASTRRPELGKVVSRMHAIVIGYLAAVLGRIAGVDRAEAGAAIAAAGGSVRTAIVMTRTGTTRAAAEALLARHDHRVRAILGDPPPVVS